jgi:hypothetical protein
VATVATPAIEIEVDGREVRVTNPDKVYFPAVGFTKRELVEHYVEVGPGILRALFNRPAANLGTVNIGFDEARRVAPDVVRPLLSGPCCPPPRGKVDAHRTGPDKCRSHPL